MAFATFQDTYTPKVRRWALLIQSPGTRQGMLMRWGATVRKKAIENARSHGGRHLWRDIARSVNVKAINSDNVEVGSDHVAAAQKQFGGVIEAKGKGAGGSDYLTIPVAEEAEGKSASKFALPTAAHPNGSGSHALFVFPNSNLLGYAEDGVFHPLFCLVKRTKRQRAVPWWPDPEFIEARGVEQAKAVLGF